MHGRRKKSSGSRPKKWDSGGRVTNLRVCLAVIFLCRQLRLCWKDMCHAVHTRWRRVFGHSEIAILRARNDCGLFTTKRRRRRYSKNLNVYAAVVVFAASCARVVRCAWVGHKESAWNAWNTMCSSDYSYPAGHRRSQSSQLQHLDVAESEVS